MDLLEWCSIAISKSQASAVDSSRLHEELQEHRDRVMQLEKCLTELTQHKIAHEKVMLDKFTLLLNEKKLKIRDQQRLLASAKVDPEKLAAVEASRKSRKAGPSRGNKRKAAQKDESEESEGHEKMDVDAPVAASVAENAQSSAGETTTGAESDDDDDERVTLPTRAAPDAAELSSPKHQEEVSKSVAPPKRALPFTKKTAVAASTTNRPASETDSDDEL